MFADGLDKSRNQLDVISDSEFQSISHLVHDQFGIVLGEEKRSLVIGRLHSCLTKRGLKSFGDYLKLLKEDKSGEIISELVNQISTNFTSFFREPAHFNFLTNRALSDVLTTLRNRRSNDLRIWCAACASGEEAYTLQMVIMRKLGLEYAQLDAGLLATDISAKALSAASQAIYSADQLKAVDNDMKLSYFKSVGADQYVVKEHVRNQILFRRFNLMNERFPFSKPFQIIFARNVMIYFDEETRRNLVRKFYKYLEPGGYLFIGHSETINSNWTDMRSILPAVYQKRSA